MPYGEGRGRVRKGFFHLGLVALGIVAFQATSSPSARESDRDSELAITQAAPTHQVGAQPAFQAENPKNNLRITFQSTGVTLSPRGGQAGGWSIDLSLAAIGSEASPSSPGSARLSTSGNRIDYDYGAVRQWYKNEESGLEQGFTLAAPPKPSAQGGEQKIVLDLSIGGNVEIHRDKPPSYFVDFVAPGGETVLRYGPLRARDAHGTILKARLEIRPAGQGQSQAVRAVVEATDPAYPIEIEAALRAPARSQKPDEVYAPPDNSVDRVGNPVTLGPGITVTVAEIMERERLSPAAPIAAPREKKPEFELEMDFLDDPSAPAVSHWPPHPAGPKLESAGDVIIGPPSLPQTVGTDFKAIGVAESGYIPPDSMGDVGPTQIVAHVNGRIRTFDKTGTLDGALNATDAVFWAPVTGLGGISDPEVRYDRLSGRWFLLGISVAENVNNLIVLAVSSGPTITDLGSFTFYSFPIGSVSPPDSTSFCDYPSLGVDANAVYTGCNMFGPGFRWTSVFVIRKSSVLSGGPIIVTGFPNVTGGCAVTIGCTTAPCNVNAGPYSPRGVDNDDPQATEGYIIGSDICFLSRLEFRRVTNPGGVPTLSGNIAMTVPATTNLNTQPASGSTTNIDPSDTRYFKASISKNKLTGVSTLWTANTVEVNTTCAADAANNRRRLGARWLEIGNLTSTPPSVVQAGTLCTTVSGVATPNTQRGFLYPTVIETGQGHMALGSSFASATEFVGTAAAGRLRTDIAGGTRAPETIVISGLNSYTILDVPPPNPNGRNRWGDYSATEVDPNDDQTVWTFQEYADDPATRWSLRVTQLRAPGPPALASATSVCTGLASTTTTITGTESCAAPTCTNGLCTGGGACPEFFDPGPDTGGPGFANHLTATVTGGVTVNPFPATNIVIPGSPSTSRVLQATLSLNTTAATAGLKNVTITNPDGQSTAGVGILNVIQGPATPTPSSNGPICAGQTLQLSTPTVPGATYSWTGPNGFASGLQNPTIPGATAAASGLYNVTVSAGGCTSSAGSTLVTVSGTGQACSDGSLCTTGDVCQAGGACAGTPVVCSASDQCHVVGTCDTGTGICSNPPKADGATCDDTNACTQTDTCQTGVCSGANPVVCSASDQCHIVGTCDTGTGVCSNPPKTDGTGCDDTNACTQTDTCQTGVCTGANPVVCTASDQCHDVGVCETVTGICSDPPKTNGAACEDGNPCTLPDTCQTGVCQAGPPADLDSDAHVSGACGGDDCNDANPLVWSAPLEVANLVLTTASPANPSWDTQATLAGPETTYDLISGLFGPGTGAAFAGGSCLQSAGPNSFSDARPDPSTGQLFWYLARGNNSCGTGTYGTVARDTSAPACP